MILDGKYILLEKSQYRTILPILYNIGYIWDPNYIVGPINESFISQLYEKHEKLTLTSTKNNNQLLAYTEWSVNNYANCDGKDELNIVKLLREYKLKRILNESNR